MNALEEGPKAACMRISCTGFFRMGSELSCAARGTRRRKLHTGRGRRRTELGGWGVLSAGTRMRTTAPGLYREARRNTPRRRLLVGTRRRVRLSSVVDTEIGARLYGDMCGAHLIGSPGFVFGGDLLAAMAEALFFFSKIPGKEARDGCLADAGKL